MKKIAILLLCYMSMGYIVMAQNTTKVTIDKRLYDVFEKDYLEQLQAVNPFLIQYHNFFLDNGYEIIDKPQNKAFDDVKEVTIKKRKKLNILKLQQEYQLTRHAKVHTYYRIKKTNKLLVLLSEKEFVKKLNKHLGRTN